MNGDPKQRKDTIIALLHKAKEAHSTAYQEVNGDDPDWPIWYAGFLLENGLATLLDAKVLKSDLIYLLVLVDKEQQRQASSVQWESFYADFLMNHYLK